MRLLARALSLCTLLLAAGCQHAAEPRSPELTSESVKNLTQKVADWQIEHFEEQGKYRALPQDPPDWANREQYHDLEWHNGALYAGMNQWRKIADDPKYTEWLKMIGERNDWALHRRPYHADDHVVGQFYLALYEDFNDPAMLNPVRSQFDWILDNPKTGTLDWNAENTHAHERWGWCDALFMAPRCGPGWRKSLERKSTWISCTRNTSPPMTCCGAKRISCSFGTPVSSISARKTAKTFTGPEAMAGYSPAWR